jgi:hypothetical protein
MVGKRFQNSYVEIDVVDDRGRSPSTLYVNLGGRTYEARVALDCLSTVQQDYELSVELSQNGSGLQFAPQGSQADPSKWRLSLSPPPTMKSVMRRSLVAASAAPAQESLSLVRVKIVDPSGASATFDKNSGMSGFPVSRGLQVVP